MIRGLIRGYWYPGMSGYHFYKKHYCKKLAKIEDMAFTEDPLDSRNFTGAYSTYDGYENPVVSIMNRMKYKQNIELSSATVAYLCYNAAKFENYDSFLWREIEFFLGKTISDMDTRTIYGCFYGLMRSNNCKLPLVESVIKDFTEKGLNKIDTYGCYELVEAISFNTREDYDAINYLHEKIMPRLDRNWKTARFLHIDSYCLKFMANLMTMDYYEKWIWDRLFTIIRKKKQIKEITSWEPYYKILLTLRKLGVEKNSNIELDETIKHFEDLWNNNVDFQWRYNLLEQRYYTVEELISRSIDTPKTLTWQEGEKYIKHNLPDWYWELELNLDLEVSDLYSEYQTAVKQKEIPDN
ncbi:hypothetical protein SteCoe_4427 [Stentor coeruleus]|uniref:Uncharacterized protein n=1 Tax=Stentor coeruleus TaxID=5963 RepID=A0A1R2CUZ3_9CILI|nr:hypothetical protein SteCoe_4427 [Stentor coeruleus]